MTTERESGNDRTGRPLAHAITTSLGTVAQHLGFAYLGEAPFCSSQPVKGIWLIDDLLEHPGPSTDLHDLIALVPLAEADGFDADVGRAALRSLAAQGVAALAIRFDTAHAAVPAELAAAAQELGLPLFLIPNGATWSALAQALSDARYQAVQANATRAEEILAQLRCSGDGGDTQDRLQQLVDWLARTVDGDVTVTSGSREKLAGAPAGAWDVMAPANETIDRVATQRIGSAMMDTGNRVVRLLSVRVGPATAVLAVARRQPFDLDSIGAANHVAGLLPLLLRLQETRQALAAARVGVLQMLMGGEVVLARRTAAAMIPGLLDAEEGRVLILSGRPEDRDRAVEECSTALDEEALVVRCPVYGTDVIIVMPVRDTSRSWAKTRLALEGVVAARPDRFLGGSDIAPLANTAGAYRDASNALVVARHRQERVALQSPSAQLVDVLDSRAHAWSQALLQPLLGLRPADSKQILDTLQLFLQFGGIGASRIAGVHRNTIANVRKRAGRLLKMDLDDVLTRTRLDLAIQVHAKSLPDPEVANPVSLHTLLTTVPARDWAERWLLPLDEDRRDLRRTLRAWIICNATVPPAAAELGLAAKTVHTHLTQAGQLLARDFQSPAGPHDLILALMIAGDLPSFNPFSQQPN